MKRIKSLELAKYPNVGTRAFTEEELISIPWMKFKIVVPTIEDKEKMELTLKYLHDQDIDTNFVWVNQLVHAYCEDNDPAVIVVQN